MQKKFLIIFLSIILTTFFVTMYSQNGTINAQSYDGEGYLYFFQGGNYIKYDYSSNKQISLNGYPRKIESSWPGLDKLPDGANNIDTAFKSADGKKYFFFKKDMYLEYFISKDNITDTLGATIPLTIENNWPGLEKFIDGAKDIDAGFCDPEGEKYYFFKGIQYIRYDISTRKVDEGFPKLISIPFRWKGLEDFQGGAGKFDTILTSKDGKKYYFFKGDEYIRYDIEEETADPGYPKKIADYFFGIDAFSSKTAGIDATIINSDNSKYYFFKGDEFISVDTDSFKADVGWPGLDIFEDGAANIDSAFVSFNMKKAYFFKGEHYVSYDTKNRQVDKGYPKDISDNWPALNEFSGGANSIDAVFYNSIGTKLYFFKNDQYIRIDVDSNSIDPGYPRSILKNWNGLEKFKSKTGSIIDGAFLSPDGNKYYFFKGDEYIVYDIVNDEVDAGYPKKINTQWSGTDRFASYNAIVLWPNPNQNFNSGYKKLSYMSQGDLSWKNIMYSSIDSSEQTIGNSGCGPTSMAMVLSSLTAKKIEPPELSEFSVKNNYRTIYNGTSWGFFPSASNKYGVSCKTMSKGNILEIRKSLKTNSYMAIASMREGYFTTGGHFIVLYGIEEVNGDIYYKVMDPNKGNRSYSPGIDEGVLIDSLSNDGKVSVREDILIDQSKGFWLFSKKYK